VAFALKNRLSQENFEAKRDLGTATI